MVNFDTFWVKKSFQSSKKKTLLNDFVLVSILPYLDAYYFTK